MSSRLAQESSTRPPLGVVIRFKNSAATLPAVLEGLRRQTLQPDFILGVNNQSADGSANLLRAVGAKVIEWPKPYNHPRVLNFALQHCPTDLVLILSSHTVLRSDDALERLVRAMADPHCACASAKWDDDAYYSDAITWQELKHKGLKICSVYSNSLGIIRRSLWQHTPFDETLPTMEDGAWALGQLQHGHVCRRLDLEFSYDRSGKDRFFVFALITFQLAARHGLRVTWLGPRGTLCGLLSSLAGRALRRPPPLNGGRELRCHFQRLWAWMTWRWRPLPTAE